MTNEEIIEKLKALNDLTRLQIVQLLSKNEVMCACKILKELNITQGTLSHHMKILTNCRLLECRKDGKWCYYRINELEILEVSKYLENLCE